MDVNNPIIKPQCASNHRYMKYGNNGGIEKKWEVHLDCKIITFINANFILNISKMCTHHGGHCDICNWLNVN